MENLAELIGKYVNESGYSDIYPIGKIIATKGKTTLIIKRVIATEQTQEMKFISGGFAGICTNQDNQKWNFEEIDEKIEMRVSKQFNRRYFLADEPKKFYDYNF